MAVFLRAIINFFWKMFSDYSGNPSTMRFLSVYVVTTIMSVWAILCFMKQELLAIGYDNMLLIAGAMGIKTIQRSIEQKGGDCEKPK
jgi:hypothetical protein